MNATLRVSFLFPYRWIDGIEDRKFLKQNLERMIRKGSLSNVFQSSATDKYFAQNNLSFIPAYFVRLKYHSYQPVPIKLTKAQLQTTLKDVYPGAKCVGFEPFFIQSSSQTALPLMEMEIYY